MGDRLTKNLYALVKHWSVFRSPSVKTAGERQIFEECVKQLRQRIVWIDNEVSEALRNEVAAILESFMHAGWIERYNMSNNRFTIWHSQNGVKNVHNLLNSLPTFSSELPLSKSVTVLKVVCTWISENQSSVSPSTHFLNEVADWYLPGNDDA